MAELLWHCLSQDSPARCHLDGGDATAVEQYLSSPVFAAKHTGVHGKCGNDMFKKFVLVDGIGLFVGEVHVVTAGEPDAKHNFRHVLKLVPQHGTLAR
jgi:hypothetical protein